MPEKLADEPACRDGIPAFMSREEAPDRVSVARLDGPYEQLLAAHR